MSRKTWLIVLTGVLSVPSSAILAATTGLYDGVGTYSVFGNVDSGDNYTTGQQFNPSNAASLPNALPATAVFDRAALHIAVDPNKPNLADPGLFTFQLRLWTWSGDFATTVGQTPIADTGDVTLPGGFDGWAELTFDPQPASGTYLLAITRKALAVSGQWRLQRTSFNSNAADSVAWRGNGGSPTSPNAQGDREFALRLHWFDPTCGATAVARVTGLGGAAGQTGDAAKVITLMGTNLDTITAASIVRRHVNGVSTSISAAGLSMAAQDLQLTFDLSGAEGGAYDLSLSHPCDRIANAEDAVLNDAALVPLKRSVVVYLPTLTNGSFEDAWDGSVTNGFCGAPRQANGPEPRHWDLSLDMSSLPGVGGAYRRDGDIYVTGCTGTTPSGGDGTHYASFQFNGNTGFPSRTSVFQTIAAPNVIGQTVHQGIEARIAYRVSQSIDQAVLRLRDGTQAGPVIASASLDYFIGDPLQDSPAVLVPAGYVFTSNPPLLTIEYEYNTTTGGSSLHASHFDHLRLVPGCYLTAADTDGDNDVDLDDFAVFQRCYSPDGPIPQDPAYCKCLDSDASGTINAEADLNAFTNCASRSSIPSPCSP